ncbi:MAG: hypothetical protein O2923_02690 [Verrucomicrobia bacterium]|nr:hypothetical protein [Verrucomicrobiota bacterium]MDA1086588.1 hypothetical protein [Verrucomicrobiota bacterium]
MSKIERWHDRDRIDVTAMLEQGLVERARLVVLFEEISEELIRYSSLDPESFRARVEGLTGSD